MNPSIELVAYGIAAPAAVAFGVMRLMPRLLPDEVSRRYAAAVAFCLAFFVGYVLLPPWAAMTPNRHWHWLPYLALASMVIGPIGLAGGVTVVERWLLHLLLAVVSAWFLVPTWASLQPLRGAYVLLLTAVVFLLSTLLDPLPARLPGRIVPAVLALAAASVSFFIAAFVSVTYGQLAGIAAAGLAGCFASDLSRMRAASFRGLVPAYAVLVAGTEFVGFVEPTPPLPGILVAACAPLALWACVAGPLSRLRGFAAVTAQTIAVLVPLTVAFFLLMLHQGSG